jgi:hypothetical protein
MNAELNHDRSLASIPMEITELQEFAQTGMQLFQPELNEKLPTFKAAVPMIAPGEAFLLTAPQKSCLSPADRK